MTAGKSAREAWEEGYSWGYTDGARVGFYDATQNPYATAPLDPEPWTVHSWDYGNVRFPREDRCWAGYRSYFEPRPGYSQNREDYQ